MIFLSVFEHFLGLVLKGLKTWLILIIFVLFPLLLIDLLSLYCTNNAQWYSSIHLTQYYNSVSDTCSIWIQKFELRLIAEKQLRLSILTTFMWLRNIYMGCIWTQCAWANFDYQTWIYLLFSMEMSRTFYQSLIGSTISTWKNPWY